jgi:uridine phosphorylase
MTRLITPEQTLSVARQAGLGDEELKLADVAVLTFSKAVGDRLEELCGLQDATWIGPQHHPYGAVRIVKRGSYGGLSIAMLVPPMGASPLSCTIEDLTACGVSAIFLVCAAWSLGPPVRFGDLIVPAFSIAPDGTSIHYGNDAGHVFADPAVVEALAAAGRERGATVHVGGNATCEALYRITPEMVEDFRQRDCLCVENGEANVVFAAARTLGVIGGVLFTPYIDLTQGWDPGRLDDEYRAACRIQAETVLGASVRLKRQELLGSGRTGE